MLCMLYNHFAELYIMKIIISGKCISLLFCQTSSLFSNDKKKKKSLFECPYKALDYKYKALNRRTRKTFFFWFITDITLGHTHWAISAIQWILFSLNMKTRVLP